MKKPRVCLKCNEIETFCECDRSIFDKDEYIAALEKSLAKDGETITSLRAALHSFDTAGEINDAIDFRNELGRKQDLKDWEKICDDQLQKWTKDILFKKEVQVKEETGIDKLFNKYNKFQLEIIDLLHASRNPCNPPEETKFYKYEIERKRRLVKYIQDAIKEAIKEQ